MKKLFSLLTALLLCLSLCIGLTSCESPLGDDDEDDHAHEYADEYSYNATYHWYACTEEDCSSKSEKEKHELDDGICTVCGYEDEDAEPEPEPEPEPDTAWSSYFEFENVTALKNTETYYPDLDLSLTLTEKMEADGEEWLYCVSELYYNGATHYDFTVYCDGTNAYACGEIDNDLLSERTYFFMNADFSLYESYFEEVSPGVYLAEAIPNGIYTLTDVRVTVKDEKIVSVGYTTDFTYEGTSYTQTTTYEFSAHCETVVDGGGYTEPSLWSSYFDIDNATITRTTSTIIPGVDDSVLETRWMVAGDKWICYRDLEVSDGNVTDREIVYFDGELAYLIDFDGGYTMIDDPEYYHYTHADLLEALPGLENQFTKAVSGDNVIYTADKVVVYGVLTYTDITITTSGDRILSIVYRIPNAIEYEGTNYSGDAKYVFTDYGTTVVDYVLP